MGFSQCRWNLAEIVLILNNVDARVVLGIRYTGIKPSNFSGGMVGIDSLFYAGGRWDMIQNHNNGTHIQDGMTHDEEYHGRIMANNTMCGFAQGGDYLNVSFVFICSIRGYEGIIFLATNRPFDLDEAMYRRITSVFTFSAWTAQDETGGDGEGGWLGLIRP